MPSFRFWNFQEIGIGNGSPVIWKDNAFKNQSFLVGLVPNDLTNFKGTLTSKNLMMNLQLPKAVKWLVKKGGKLVQRCNKDNCECGLSDVNEKIQKPAMHSWQVTISVNWKVNPRKAMVESKL